MGRLIINGNQVYEIDEDCMKQKKQNQKNDPEQSGDANRERNEGREKQNRNNTRRGR